jgi:hypothetical protein
MNRAVSRFQPIIFGLIFLAFWGGNAFALRSPALGALLVAAWLYLCGKQIGRGVMPDEHPALQTWLGAWLLLSAASLAGAAVYYVASFSADVAYGIVMLSVPVSIWIGQPRTEEEPDAHDLWDEKPHRVPWAVWFSAAGVIGALALFVRALLAAATTSPIRSAWMAVSPSAFVALFLAALLLVALLWNGRERALTLPLATLSLLAFLSVATLVFPLGFGFDPFIHRATVEHIAATGTITPKPLYYVGEYALELIAFHGFSLPVDLTDAWLLPVLAALFIPFAWYGAAVHLLKDRRLAAASLAGLFLLPLGSFISTTPQGLADLWTLLLVLAAVPALVRGERAHLLPLALAAVAAAVIHPIAGIPALLFLVLAALYASRERFPRAAMPLFWTVAALGSFALPASFALNALRGGTGNGLDLSAFGAASLWQALRLNLFFQNGFRPLLDFAYLYGSNALAIVLLLAAGGWLVARRRDLPALPFVALAVALGVNYLLLSTAVDFSFLIDYERQNYADRLLPLVAVAVIPLAILAVGEVLRRARRAPAPLRVFAIALLAAGWTAAWYMDYPRNDAFEVGHGINVSQSDVNAVYDIDRVAGGVPYAVLADQSVSAAAVKSLGFAHYYGDQFFYPIPTGGALYQVFLDMNDHPTRETVQKAFALLPVKTVFFAVNDYWWQSDRIVETAKGTADSWFAIDDGKVTVFRYDRK